MHVFETIHGGLEKVARFAVWVGGAALLLAAIMVTLDVLARKFLGVTMSGSDEISGYVFAGGTTWAYSYCAIHRSNIRIDALYNFLPYQTRANPRCCRPDIALHLHGPVDVSRLGCVPDVLGKELRCNLDIGHAAVDPADFLDHRPCSCFS